MKRLKKLIVWCAVGLILENAIFIYINTFYLNHNLTIKAVKVEKKQVGPDKNVQIPSDSTNVQASFDGRFISYYEGDSFKVGNRVSGSVNEIIPAKNMSVCYSKWMPEDNLMLLAEKPKDSAKSHYLTLYSYDAKKNTKRELLDFNMKTVKIDISSKKENIEDIVFSTSTHVIYIKLSKVGGRSGIYTLNVMNQLEKVNANCSFIGKIATLAGNTNFIYEDKVYNKIKNLDGNSLKELSKNKNFTLLASDKNDKLYIGEFENNLINKIFFGDINTPMDKWQIVNLPSPIASKNIIITRDGRIFTHNPIEGSICNMESNVITKYEGKFIDLCTCGIISVLNNKTKVTPLK